MVFEKLPFLLLTLLFIYIGIEGQNEGGALNSSDEIPFIKRPFIASYGLIIYSLKAFVPYNLSTFYPYPNLSNLPWYFYVSSIPVIVVIIYSLKQWKNKPLLVFGSFFFMITVFPVSQIIPFGMSIMADRYTYIPYLGLFFIFAFYFEKIINTPKLNSKFRTCLFSIFGGYILLLGCISNNRSKVWKNDVTLWKNVLVQYPKSYFALANLGNYWFQKGENTKALDYYNKTIEVEKRYFMAFNNRGLIYQSQGDTIQAIANFNQAIKLKKYPKAYINKGVLLFQQGNNIEAIAAFKKGIELDKNYGLAWFNLGNVYYKNKDFELALNSFSKAENLGYRHIYVYLLKASLYDSKEMSSNAIKELKTGLKRYPNNEDALIELSKQYIKERDFNEAIKRLKKSTALYPKGKHGEAYFLLYLIYTELHQLELAQLNLEKAKEFGYNL